MSGTWHGRPLIFVSYRTVDQPSTSFMLYRELADRFGKEAVFRDCDSLLPGTDFEPALLDAVRGSLVLLVVIGDRWLNATDQDGRRLVDSTEDWVRVEIGEAIRQGVRIVPVLVGDVAQLTRSDLPADIKVLANLQFVRLRHRFEEQDIAALIERLLEEEPGLQAHVRLGLAPMPAERPTRFRRVVATPDRIEQAAGLLARQVFQQWSDEIVAWQIDEPKILMRWWFEPEDTSVGPAREWTSGAAHSVAELCRWVHSLPRLRLAIVGDGGAGKTSVAMQLVRELAGRYGIGHRVPILVRLAGWNPHAESLSDWLAGLLAKDYPALLAPEFGRNAVTELLRSRRILPVLDGLDELPQVAQRAVMRGLRRLSDNDAWIITSRIAEFEALSTVERSAVDATLTAQQLSAEESERYLRRLVRDDPRWRPILQQLTAAPWAPLSRAMRTPLTLWLLRSTYVETDTHPAPLADFDDPEQLRRHLLGELVPSLVTSRPPVGRGTAATFRPVHTWSADNCRYWLTNLAVYLRVHESSELAWWTLTDLGPRRPRLVLGLVMTVTTGLLTGVLALATIGVSGLLPTAAFVLFFGIGAFQCRTDTVLPQFASIRLAGRTRSLLERLLQGALAGVMLSGLLVLGSYIGTWMTPDSLFRPTPTAAAISGMLITACLALCQWITEATPLDAARTPALILSADRRLTLAYVGLGSASACAYIAYILARTSGFAAALVLCLSLLPAWAIFAGFTRSRPAGRSSGSKLRGHAWPNYVLAVSWAWASGLFPRRFMPFLVDMHRIGILKQVGGVYLFRHADLQEVLVAQYLDEQHDGQPAN